MKNKITYIVGCLLSAALVCSCSDWTKIESEKIVQPDIATQNPGLYAKYLENLRAYKQSEHRPVCVWFDNSEKVPYSRGQHINELPDSIDVVSLMSPQVLTDLEQQEIKEVREKKGMKVIYTISFEAIKTTYNDMVGALPDGEPASKDFETFLFDTLATSFNLARKWNYDGVCVAYEGKSQLTMTTAEKLEYTANEKMFLGFTKDWKTRNPNKYLMLMGNPQNLTDATILNLFDCIMISGGKTATNQDMFSFLLEMAMDGNADFPTNRVSMLVSTPSTDPADPKTGFFSDGSRTLPGVAEWIATKPNGIPSIGIGILNVQVGYYNTSRAYAYTRDAISIINPY